MITADANRAKSAICTICLTERGATHADESENNLLKNSEVSYGKNADPTKLEAHMRSTHKQLLAEHNAAIAKDKGQASDFMEHFVVKNPDYACKHLEWVCRTLQPINTCDDPS